MLLDFDLIYKFIDKSTYANSPNIHSDESQQIFIVACSGGADSICLLHSLHTYLSEKNIKENIIVAHFNHRWSEFSDKPAQLVHDFCQKLNITLEYGEAKQAGQNSEAEAREERYEFLTTIAKKSIKENKLPIILTAHHLDDQIETFFLRLFRGTGSEGLKCIQKERELAFNIKLWRPLLEIDKGNLINYCQINELPYYEDPSNEQLDIKRNQIRKQIIPLIEKLQPSYKKQISNLIEIVQEESGFISQFTKELSKENFSNTQVFCEQAIAIQREILKSIVSNYAIVPMFDLIERLRESIVSANSYNSRLGTSTIKISLNKNLFFECNQKYFGVFASTIPKRQFPIARKFKLDTTNTDEQIIEIPSLGRLIISKALSSQIHKERNSYKVLVNLSKLENNILEIRDRFPRDIFQPINCNYSVKLKKFLIDRKIHKRKNLDCFESNHQESSKKICKENIFVVSMENSNNILWIPGVELSDLIKVKDKASHLLEFDGL